MAIQWFPGHMHVTRKAIAERLKTGIDVVIELLDARLPGSSANPLLATLTEGKPALKLLNKQDLADPARTALWLAHYNALPETRAIGLDASEVAPAAKLIAACRALAPLRGGMVKPMRVLICGIPNVGKSTLINTLVGKKAAKTGDEAGITKLEQCIVLASDFNLYDTPGMLWPRITVPQSGYLLAASGGIGRNAYDDEEVALELLAVLQADYPDQIVARYRLPGSLVGSSAASSAANAAAVAALQPDELLAVIARARGLIQSGGRIDPTKAAEVVLKDFRSGALGRITLETPAIHAGWLLAAQAEEGERVDKKAGKSKSRRRR